MLHCPTTNAGWLKECCSIAMLCVYKSLIMRTPFFIIFFLSGMGPTKMDTALSDVDHLTFYWAVLFTPSASGCVDLPLSGRHVWQDKEIAPQPDCFFLSVDTCHPSIPVSRTWCLMRVTLTVEMFVSICLTSFLYI